MNFYILRDISGFLQVNLQINSLAITWQSISYFACAQFCDLILVEHCFVCIALMLIKFADLMSFQHFSDFGYLQKKPCCTREWKITQTTKLPVFHVDIPSQHPVQ